MVPLNVPNVLTVVRILLVPVLVVALLEKTGGGDLLAAVVFAVASLTDAIDGYLARSRNWVTTFGKLMDPIADKLLIVAALVALVSLGRLEAWVAMVIISREFAVTALRLATGAQQGIVISASSFGKLKTATQVVMVMALIAFDDRSAWITALVYVTVVITVLSGADYFFGLRRRLTEKATRSAGGHGHRGLTRVEPALRRRAQPGGQARVGWRHLARVKLAANLAEGAEALGDDVVLMDRLEVDLARRHERVVAQGREAIGHAADHLPHAILDEARAAVGLLDHVRLVGALHQLVDLG